jgi:hypothetical protein
MFLAGFSRPAFFFELAPQVPDRFHTEIWFRDKKNAGFRSRSFQHQNSMHTNHQLLEHKLRIPAEPEPFPIKEPPDPPENPDMPVREPDPEDTGQI